MWFSIVYLLAAYIRLYPENIFTGQLRWAFISVLLCFLGILCIIGTALLSHHSHEHHILYFSGECNRFFPLAIGCSTFLFFKNLRLAYSGIINIIASTVFGILCFHTGSDAWRDYLWNKCIKSVDCYNSPYFLSF